MDTDNTKTSTAIQTERKKEHRTTEEEMEGRTSSGGSRNRLTRLNLHEHNDDDDDDVTTGCEYCIYIALWWATSVLQNTATRKIW
jgi:hypothetical protein